MKRSIKLVVCMLLVATIALPSVFATGLGSSSSLVKVGTVDTTDVNYNVDIEWGSLVYNFVQSDNGEYYVWEPEEEWFSNRVSITNNSNIIVNAKVEFTSAISNVIGMIESNLAGAMYSVLTEEPEDFATGYYYTMNEEGRFVRINGEETFEADKYYEILGGGAAPSLDGNIPAVDEFDGMPVIMTLEADLTLEGGSLSDVRPGATIGTLTVTIS